MVSRRTDTTMRWVTRPLTYTVLAAVLGAIIGAAHNGEPARGAAIGALSLWALVITCLILVIFLQPDRLRRDIRSAHNRKRAASGRRSR